MSIHISSPCWKIECPTAGQKLILLKLADNANDAGVCWPSLSTIAKDCGCSTRTVSRAIVYFESINLLSHDRRFNSSNTYQFNMDTLSILSSRTIDTMSTPIDTMSIPIDTVSNAIDTSVSLTVIEPSLNRHITKEKSLPVKSENQLRIEKLFNRRVTTPMDKAEISAWASAKGIVDDMTDREWTDLEVFYAAPQEKTYARKTLSTLLNNLSGELDKAANWSHQHTSAQLKISKPTVWS
jgi:hypothetical protein